MQNEDPRNIFVNQRYNDNDKTTDTTTTQQNNGTSDYDQKVAEMKRLADKYQREGEGQLVNDIIANVIEQKAKGTLNNDQLKAFAQRVTPLLNSEQRNRLDQLLEQLLKL